MERQLIKVAKELNIGMGSIVDYLTEKGFDVENKPNAKLSDGMYDALMKKFSDSKAEKQQADQIVIGTRPVVKPPTPSVQAPTLSSHSQAPAQEKKTINLFPPKETPKVDEKPVVEFIERPKVILQQPKVIDKIDLNSPKKEHIVLTPPPVQPKPEVKPVDVKQPEPKPIVSQPTQQPQQQQQQRKDHQQPHRQSERPHHQQQPQQQQRQQQPHNRPQQQQHQRHEPQQPVIKPPVELPKPPVVLDNLPLDNESTESRIANDGGDELIRAEAPQLRGLKIKGKIDIDKFIEKEKGFNNPGDRNKNKNKNKKGVNTGRPGDRPAVPGQVKPADGTQKPGQPAGTASDADARKRKRKRKKIPTAPGTTGTNTGTTNNSGQNNTTTGGANRPSGPNDRPRTGGVNDNRGPRRTDPVPVSQQQIEAKIKETMARLNLGGKNKGQKLRRDKRGKIREREELRQIESQGAKLQVAEFISVSDLASVMDIAPTQIITTCMSMGIFCIHQSTFGCGIN